MKKPLYKLWGMQLAEKIPQPLPPLDLLDFLYELGELNEQRIPNISYKQYISSDVWKQRTELYKRYYECTCQRCHKDFSKSNGKYMVLHHKHYKTMGNEHVDDLVLLCRRCHKISHLNDDK